MRQKLKLFALAFGLLFTLVAHAQMKYVEGQDYTVLKTPIMQTTGPTVTELFWFGCPHCNALRPVIEKWIKNTKPDDVKMQYIPAVIGSPYWDKPAQAYFTMQALGVTDKLFDDYFDTVHKNHDYSILGSNEAIKAFFVKHGVNGDDFDKTWKSFKVQQEMKKAQDLFAKSGLDGVPALLVNGKYIVQTQDDNFPRMLDIAQTLATE